MRRTAAHDSAGGWVVIDLWRSADDADAMGECWATRQAPAAFMAFVAAGTVHVHRYETLD